MMYKHDLPPQPLIYDPKLGYVTPQRLGERAVRQDVNRLSLAAMSTLAAAVIGGMLVVVVTLVTGSWEMPSVTVYAMTGFMTALGTGLPFAIYMLVKRRHMAQYLRFEKVGAVNALLYVLAGLGGCLAFNIPSGWLIAFLERLGITLSSAELPVAEGLGGNVVMYVAVAILPAVFEEFAFRGVMLSALRKYGDGLAIVTSSVIFGLMHLSPVNSLWAIFAGLLLGFLYVKTGNLWVSIAVHLLNNAVAVTGLLLGQERLIANLLLLYIPIALGIGAVLLLWRTKRLDFRFNRAEIALPAGRGAFCVLSNPGFILLVLTFITFGLLMLTGGLSL